MAATRSEGLGLGCIDMPGNDITARVSSQQDSHDRYHSFKSKVTKHKSSSSSPSSLAPFAEQLAATQQSQLASSRNSVQGRKGASTGSVSYPTLVTRNEIMLASSDSSTYLPPRTPPTPMLADRAEVDPGLPVEEASGNGRSRSRSSPTKATSGRDSKEGFLSPLNRDRPFLPRFGSQEKKKLGEKDTRQQIRADSRSPIRSKALRAGSITADAEDSDVVSITMARAKELQESFEARMRKDSGYGSMSGPSIMPSDSLATSEHAACAPFAQPRKGSIAPQETYQHRRANSDGSPSINSQATFDRSHPMSSVAYPERPHTTYSKSAGEISRRPTGAAAGTPSETRYMSGILEDCPSPRRLPLSPTSSRRPSAVPRPLDTSNSIGISVHSKGNLQREVGRAPFDTEDGATVLLRSQHRPEDLEVGWTCTSGVDSAGRPWTQWEVALRPKICGADDLSRQFVRPVPQKSLSFSTYRLAPPEGYKPTPSQDEPVSPVRSGAAPLTSPHGPPISPPSQSSYTRSVPSPRRPSVAQTGPIAVPILSKPPPPLRKRSIAAESCSSSDSSIRDERRPSATEIATATRVVYMPQGSEEDPMTPTRASSRAGSIISQSASSPRGPSFVSPTRPRQGAGVPTPPYRLETIPPTPADELEGYFPEVGLSHSLSSSPTSTQDALTPEDDRDVSRTKEVRRETELAFKDQQRVMSKWSDTEDDVSEDDGESIRHKTSWSDVDGLEEDLIMVGDLGQIRV